MRLFLMSSLLLNNRNHNCYIRFLILLSGDISLNPGPPVNLTQINNDWKIFEQRGFHMAHININSLLPEIDELRTIAYSTKLSVIGITESKLDDTVTNAEISIEGYDVLRCDRNRRGEVLRVT